MIPLLVIHLIKIVCVIGVMLGIVAYTVLAERKNLRVDAGPHRAESRRAASACCSRWPMD
jgi:hypothetical protein